jgi:hypothetical protein
MLAANIPPTAAACRSCGAYGGSDHRACQPGRRLELERSPRAARDRRTSSLARAQIRLQNRRIRHL